MSAPFFQFQWKCGDFDESIWQVLDYLLYLHLPIHSRRGDDARNAHGSDPERVEWFTLALYECRRGLYFCGLDEYFNPLREGYIALTGVEGRGLPLPPPGDSDTQSVY